MRTDAFRVVIAGGPFRLRVRTERSLARLGVFTHDACEIDGVGGVLDDDVPTWILRAGAWLHALPHVPKSATGRPVLGFGAIRGDDAWDDLIAGTAGVLDGQERRVWPRVASVLAESPHALRSLLEAGASLDESVWRVARDGRQRAVRVHTLDVGFDERLRACVAVTALRRGGAERIALDLERGLTSSGVRTLFAVMHATSGDAHEAPEGALRVYARSPKHGQRVDALARAASDFGADVIHVHLFGDADLRELARHGIPLVVTVHNDRARWSNGFGAVTNEAVALTLGCSWRVRDALIAEGRRAIRVAPNFVEPRVARGVNARAELGLPDSAIVLLSVANPRPQKRLELAIETLAALRGRGHDAYLVMVGGAMPGDDGDHAMAAIDGAVTQTGMASYVRRVGSQRDVGAMYAAADVLLTTSAYEGMSVVQLEALAAGTPVVTTDVGGARELGAQHDGYIVASAAADALANGVEEATAGARPKLAPSFTLEASATRHARVYAGAALHDTARGGLVLVINNLATGGAQASARRLLLELRARGHEVAAAVLQEQPRFPTPWRAELAQRVPLFVAPRAGTCDASVTASAVADFVRTRRARQVVFWNVMALYKLLIADELTSTTLYDVSPGEMYFAELERYFDKPRPDLPYFGARDYGTLLDGVVVKFTAEAERAKRVLGAPVTVIPNGVAVARALPTRRPRGARFVIGTLARISPDKKLEQLFSAMQATPDDCELRIAGRVEAKAEEHAAELRARARDLRVELVGEVEPSAFLADLDAFALVSEPEGCPNALLEAMAAGLPVAATNVGGVSEAVDDGETGLLVPRGDAPELGRALARLSRDPHLARALGRAAHARIAERFSLARMADAYESLFGLAGEHHGSYAMRSFASAMTSER